MNWLIMIMVYDTQFMDIGKIGIMIKDPSLFLTWGVGDMYFSPLVIWNPVDI